MNEKPNGNNVNECVYVLTVRLCICIYVYEGVCERGESVNLTLHVLIEVKRWFLLKHIIEIFVLEFS